MPGTKVGWFRLDAARRLTIAGASLGQKFLRTDAMRRGPPLSRSVLPPWPVLMLMLTASVIMALTETTVGYHIVHLDGLIDPDSYMQIVRIRDGLHAGWFTHVVTADNGGKGTVIYWSHLIDAIVLALRAPLRLFLNDQAALFVAAATTGPIFAALLAAVLVWAPSPLVHPHWPWLWTAPLAALLSPAIFIYGLLGYVHYHLPLILMAALAAACAGRATTGRADAGFWCGISSAVGIWLSSEALPYVLMAMGAIGVAWCLRPAALANALKACGAGFGAATAAAVLIDPPYRRLAVARNRLHLNRVRGSRGPNLWCCLVIDPGRALHDLGVDAFFWLSADLLGHHGPLALVLPKHNPWPGGACATR